MPKGRPFALFGGDLQHIEPFLFVSRTALVEATLHHSLDQLCWSGTDALNTSQEGNNKASYTNTSHVTPRILNWLLDTLRSLPSSPLEIRQAGRFADPSELLLVPAACPRRMP